MLELHITGEDGAALAPDHVRMILTAPTTEFKAISLVGVVAALVLSALLWRHGARVLRWVTPTFAIACALVYLAGYGVG